MNSNKRLIITTILLLTVLGCVTTFSQRSYAVEDGDDTQYNDCLRSHTDNTSWSSCGYEEVKRRQTALDAAYGKALKLSKADDESSNGNRLIYRDTYTMLMIEQEEWKDFQKHACEYYKNPAWGRETNVLNYPMCKAGIIKQRIRELNSLIEKLTPH